MCRLWNFWDTLMDTQSFGKPAFLAPCRFFSPPQNGALMFNIKNAGSDDLLLKYVKLRFRYHGSDLYPTLVFTWKGWHWFTSENQDSWHAMIINHWSPLVSRRIMLAVGIFCWCTNDTKQKIFEHQYAKNIWAIHEKALPLFVPGIQWSTIVVQHKPVYKHV